MTHVILVLLAIIQAMFFINAWMNEGVIFFNIYIWGFVALFSIFTGVLSFINSSSEKSDSFNIYLSLTLITVSLVSLGYIIYLAAFKPYYL